MKIAKKKIPIDFVVLNKEEDGNIPLILGSHFVAAGKALINVANGTLTLKVQEETITFNVL